MQCTTFVSNREASAETIQALLPPCRPHKGIHCKSWHAHSQPSALRLPCSLFSGSSKCEGLLDTSKHYSVTTLISSPSTNFYFYFYSLIMLLIQSDMFKALWFMIYPIVVFARGPVPDNSTFCQVSGFFLSLGIEASGQSCYLKIQFNQT